jgi:O-antigen ligase
MFIVVAIVCAYLLSQMNPHTRERLLLAGVLPILFVGLALTYSRTGYLALVVSLFFVSYRLAKTQGYVILAASILMLGLIVPLLPDAFYDRVGTILPAVEKQDDTVGIRLQRWKYAMQMIKDHPVAGVGPNNFIPALMRYGRGDVNRKQGLVVHNTFLNVGAEMGLVGLALFILTMGSAFREVSWIIRRFGRSRDLILAGNAIEISLGVMLIEGLMGNIENLKFTYVLFGLACSIGRLAILESKQPLGALAGTSGATTDASRPPAMPETVSSLAP